MDTGGGLAAVAILVCLLPLFEKLEVASRMVAVLVLAGLLGLVAWGVIAVVR
jgi:hypothetical protein